MDEKFKDFVSKNRKQLTKLIDSSNTLEPLLIELAETEDGKCVLTEGDLKNIRRAGEMLTRIGTFFQILDSKPEVFVRFEKAIRETGQIGLIKIVDSYLGKSVPEPPAPVKVEKGTIQDNRTVPTDEKTSIAEPIKKDDHERGLQADFNFFKRQKQPQLLAKYSMDKDPRGNALIINNMNFQHISDRQGSDIDENTLVSLFNHLKFKTFVERDCSCADMLLIVEAFAETFKGTDMNAAVVCILSHGDDHGLVYGVDSKSSGITGVPAAPSVKLRDLISRFNPKQCPDLNGKPKLFFIQACRGDRVDGTVPDGADHCNPAESQTNTELTGEKLKDIIYGTKDQGDLSDESDSPGNGISNIDDYLLSFATGWGYYAWRNVTLGSPYITVLDRVLRNHPNEDILSILTEVKNEVVKTRPEHKMASPGFYSHLSKKLHLNGGKP